MALKSPVSALQKINRTIIGIIHLRIGRTLSVPIIPGGIGDTIDFILIFLGKYPGM